MSLKRTGVGDRYVVEEMKSSGCNFGGEQSGHIIMSDYSTTGDGLISALQVLSIFSLANGKFSEIGRSFIPVPQKLVNIEYKEDNPLGSASLKSAISDAEKTLYGIGRVLVRKSGTEPILRIMVEADSQSLVDSILDNIVSAVDEKKR